MPRKLFLASQQPPSAGVVVLLFGYLIFIYFKSKDLIEDDVVLSVLERTFVVVVLIDGIAAGTSPGVTLIIPVQKRLNFVHG
ncbi:hypothetical protein [Paenibacillus mesotrionivorans]|uniref:Uncharacterized protein n=1 Tax=Paenibacillus mesotrionivorans TaxID=3160968 RepID=A0ACC7NYR4_9BACL